MTIRYVFQLVLISALLCLTGCALTSERVSINYKPISSSKSIKGADKVTVELKITDNRDDKTRISCKKNGFGNELAPIRTTESVTQTIANAIKNELKARGFKYGTNPNVLVKGDLTRFYNNFQPGFFACDAFADFNIGISVYSKTGQEIYTRQIVAHGTLKNIQLMTGDNAKEALDNALQDGITQLFNDQSFIDSLIMNNITANSEYPHTDGISQKASSGGSTDETFNKMVELKKMRDSGYITQQEYEKKKAKLLDKL